MQMEGKKQTPDVWPKWKLGGCLFGLVIFTISVCLMLFVGPILIATRWRDEYRLRRFYRCRNRLLDWTQTRERLSAKRGTLIVAVYTRGLTSGRLPRNVWWVEDDILTKYCDCPLAPIGVLHSNFEGTKRRELLHNPSAQAWWKVHSLEFGDGVFLVQMPNKFSRDWDGILPECSAVAVADYWTYQWEDWKQLKPG